MASSYCTLTNQHTQHKLCIDSKINWLGWVNANERLSIFQAADLMVLPSPVGKVATTNAVEASKIA